MKFNKADIKPFYFTLLGLLAVEVCFSIDSRTASYDDCNVRGGGKSYYIGSRREQTWQDAHRQCQYKNSSLPVIRCSEEQTAFEKYLKKLDLNALSTNAVWTSGKKKVYNDWTWINGQTLNRNHYTKLIIIPSGPAVETHMTIILTDHSSNVLRPAGPLNSISYLCQYKGRQCRDRFAVNATYGCLVPSGNNKTSWDDARKSCLSGQGDLAILADQDIQILNDSRIPYSTYWIGLRKENWVWKTGLETQAAAEEDDEVKYTNWANAPMRADGDLCISNYINDSQWRASLCNVEMLSVVCEKRDKEMSGSTVNSTTGENTTITAAIVAGAVILILCIFAILVVICRKSKSSSIKTEPAQIDSETKKESKDMNTEEMSSKPNEERCIYAEIPLTEQTAIDAPEAGQGGTNYASLDFNKGVTLQIQINCIQHSDGSGPIYAQPLKANINQNEPTTGGSFSILSVHI